MNRLLSIIWIFGFLILFFLTSCSSYPKIHAKGNFNGEMIETTVDSEIARYYLENYLQGKKDNKNWDEKIDVLNQKYGQTIPSREDLVNISTEFSVDFASLFLATQLLKDEKNSILNQSFIHYLDNETVFNRDISSYLILFIPGWDYVENGHLTGADFAQPRKLATTFGFENRLIDLPPTGSVNENADYLATEIKKFSNSGKKILLVGASSAGPAIHLVLSEKLQDEEVASIKAWLNLGGILQGSPLIDFLQERPQRWLFNLVVWFKGWDTEAILSMDKKTSRTRFKRLQIEKNILVINYIGIPLSGTLSQYGKDNYSILKPEGPNDGITLITDVIAPNSLTIVALGNDHFFAEDRKINEKTIALMKLLIHYLENT
ncbi:MAG: hypothetical protein HQK65_15140 [Desulfamplus sp.]|nr:hypothetical protein [Desulfamplus sp.]